MERRAGEGRAQSTEPAGPQPPCSRSPPPTPNLAFGAFPLTPLHLQALWRAKQRAPLHPGSQICTSCSLPLQCSAQTVKTLSGSAVPCPALSPCGLLPSAQAGPPHSGSGEHQLTADTAAAARLCRPHPRLRSRVSGGDNSPGGPGTALPALCQPSLAGQGTRTSRQGVRRQKGPAEGIPGPAPAHLCQCISPWTPVHSYCLWGPVPIPLPGSGPAC